MSKFLILLVDDDELVLEGVRAILEAEGYRVTTAESGEEAIERLEKTTFDLVITDLVMENVDGFEVAKKAKELSPETTTMVLTGYKTTDFAIDALRIGVDDYLIKPCATDDILFSVRRCLEKGKTNKECKRAEEALWESEEKLSSFIDAATEDFVLYDSELNLVEINKKALEIFPKGTIKENLIGKNILDISPGLVKTGRYDKYLEIIKTGKSVYFDDIVPNSKFGDVHLSVKGFKVGQGFGLIINDITERNKVEEELRAERDSQQALLAGLDATGLGVDIVGTDYRVRFQNAVLQDRFGDLTGKLCYENYRGLDAPCGFCPMKKAIASGSVERVEHTGPDGREYELVSAPLAGPDGTRDRAVEVVRDITERKKIEEEREKLISDLQTALAKIKTLSGIIPICAKCKKIRDDNGYWTQVEEYIRDHTTAEFSHGLCPECVAEMEKEIDEME